MTHRYGGSEFGFLREDVRGIAVVLNGAKRPIIWVVRDATYPDMWRVQFPNGRLSTMANKVRAKDAALGHAAAILNGRAEAAGSPVARLDGEAA
jgi:hypothetical protein